MLINLPIDAIIVQHNSQFNQRLAQMSTAVLSRDNISESVILDAISKPADISGKNTLKYSV